MTRSVALRASVLFVLLAALFAATGLASHVAIAEALFLIASSLCVLMLLFAASAPARAPIAVRARSRR